MFKNPSAFYGKSPLSSFPGGLLPASIVSTWVAVPWECLISGLSLAIKPNRIHGVELHMHYPS